MNDSLLVVSDCYSEVAGYAIKWIKSQAMPQTGECTPARRTTWNLGGSD